MRTRLIIYLILICISVRCQELVPNGSFEEFKNCPAHEACFNGNVLDWFSTNKATPDLFATCSPNKFSNANNSSGTKAKPFAGNAYVGIALYYKGHPNYREYIGVKLMRSLKADSLYSFRMRLRITEYAKYSVDTIQVAFVNKRIHRKGNRAMGLVGKIISLPNIANDTLDWCIIHFCYRAQGGERYLIIGNFEADSESGALSNKLYVKQVGVREGSYEYVGDCSFYTIDSVSLKEIKPKVSNTRFGLRSNNKSAIFHYSLKLIEKKNDDVLSEAVSPGKQS